MRIDKRSFALLTIASLLSTGSYTAPPESAPYTLHIWIVNPAFKTPPPRSGDLRKDPAWFSLKETPSAPYNLEKDIRPLLLKDNPRFVFPEMPQEFHLPLYLDKAVSAPLKGHEFAGKLSKSEQGPLTFSMRYTLVTSKTATIAGTWKESPLQLNKLYVLTSTAMRYDTDSVTKKRRVVPELGKALLYAITAN